MVRRWVGGLARCVAALVLVAGCGAKDPELGPLGETDGRTQGLSESELGRAGNRGSLGAYEDGTLGSEQGPLSDIHFNYNSVDLDQAARTTLQRNADWLAAHPTARVEIEGHCDERGTIEYNLALGARRAAAAKDYLIALGVSPSRITTISYGEELPLCREMNESCWYRNRRGHFVVFGGP